jgi:hypothetical protein
MFAEYAAELSPYSVFGDTRVNARFPQTLQQIGENFDLSIPQGSKDNAQMQSVYHFFFKPTGQAGIYALV